MLCFIVLGERLDFPTDYIIRFTCPGIVCSWSSRIISSLTTPIGSEHFLQSSDHLNFTRLAFTIKALCTELNNKEDIYWLVVFCFCLIFSNLINLGQFIGKQFRCDTISFIQSAEYRYVTIDNWKLEEKSNITKPHICYTGRVLSSGSGSKRNWIFARYNNQSTSSRFLFAAE